MRDFWKTVGAYLTGWVIAQTVFTRVLRRDYSWEEEKEDIADRAADFTVKRMMFVGPKAMDYIDRKAHDLGDDVYDELRERLSGVTIGASTPEAVEMTHVPDGAPVSVTREMIADAIRASLGRKVW